MMKPLRSGLWILAAFFAAFVPPAAAQQPLGSYRIDPDEVSISGISSGAFMAGQFHIAHSELIMGAGLVAGGLYSCAVLSVDFAEETLDATVSRALDRCMAARAPVGSVETYKRRIEAFAAHGWIDPLSGLAGDRVYLFTGRADTKVSPRTVERTAELYRALGVTGDALEFQRFLDHAPGGGAGHAWLTETCCQACPANGPPYINDCDYDQAGAILQQIYGPLRAKAESSTGQFVEFDQREFAPDGKAAVNGLSDTGVVYVPKACAAGETCALHVVLHGCKQSTEVLGDEFYKKIGMNAWADTNHIVVLYPQAHSVDARALDAAYPGRLIGNTFQVNPDGCWNWWGYSYDDRFALKDGVQIRALYDMIERLMGNSVQ